MCVVGVEALSIEDVEDSRALARTFRCQTLCSVAGPVARKALSDDLRDPSLTADNFRKRLKTHLFRNALGHVAQRRCVMRYINLRLTVLLYYVQIISHSILSVITDLVHDDIQ